MALPRRAVSSLAAAALATVATGALRPAPAAPETTTELLELHASDGSIYDQFGVSVDASGDTLVVGAVGLSLIPVLGKAYVFRRDGASWVEEDKLEAWDTSAYLAFGLSVGIDGDRVVAGAWRDGATYVFRYDGMSWVQDEKLTGDVVGGSTQFGFAVAVAGDTIAVGAQSDNDNGQFAGAAFVFRHDGATWVQEGKLLASDGASFDTFGGAIAVDGDTIVVGASQHDGSTGAAYVFRRNGGSWAEEAKLSASDGAADDLFGRSVAIVDDRIAVGASQDDSEAGSAYVFDYNGSAWLETQKLGASDGTAGDRFGTSVALTADAVAVGAGLDSDNGSSSGSAYLFRHDELAWVEVSKLLASDGAAGDQLGVSVAVTSDTVAVGAVGDDDNGENSGSAYLFTSVPSVPAPALDLIGQLLLGSSLLATGWSRIR